ncbi:conserved protein of unknown function [Cupriavidus taiwanensis]|uniref:Uncharacterized protein n=1 Tax=Cupriavidus taiwanensis TaxID=164546 RepID=A0A375IJX2_9BURK|nr:hypothetical protein [Cupriavidus taiwanensis]SPK73722.1 conserved protein of unknown function [Cupriavidus taiwanensis]
MTVRLYKSTDASAPSLTGQVGSLVALLDAVLVNGYGSQSAAGWTKAYSATNKASYRMATSGNTGFYLDVDDSAPSTAKEARMRGYEAMTAVATGTNPFPTSAQLSTGIVCRKSTTADSTTRPWYIIADGSCFYLFVDTNDVTGYACSFAFGDFFSYKSGDSYRCTITGRYIENSGANNYEMVAWINNGTTPLFTATSAHYVARNWTGVGGSIGFAKFTSLLAGQSNALLTGSIASFLPYPNSPDSALELAPLFIGHTYCVRGYMKGMWCPLHAQPLGHGDTFTGTGNMAGKSFIALNVQNNSASQGNGQIVIEYSDTWS